VPQRACQVGNLGGQPRVAMAKIDSVVPYHILREVQHPSQALDVAVD